MLKQKPYWLEVPAITGDLERPKDASIVVIGSGFAGVSCGLFLQEKGFENILIVDDQPNDAATFRNCGHILHGTVESMKAFSEIHGIEKARDLWAYSVEICDLLKDNVKKFELDCEYRQDGYLVVAVNESEDRECRESVKLLNDGGFENHYFSADEVRRLGFKNAAGARFEPGSACAHPTKFRNEILKRFINRGGRYHSGVKVTGLQDTGDGVEIQYTHGGPALLKGDAAVIAANAYSPLFSEFFNSRRLIEPFRGQIITSRPLKHKFKVTYPHSFDHGYEYALVTADNRLMLGGWRNHSPTKEVGTYDLGTNPMIEQGLMEFARENYDIAEDIQWEFTWSGIMGASATSLPFVGPTNSDRIYACGGFTGHGFSWGHGCAYLLAQIMAGEELPKIAPYLNPKAI